MFQQRPPHGSRKMELSGYGASEFQLLVFSTRDHPRLVMMKPPPLVCASGKFTSFFGGNSWKLMIFYRQIDM